MNKIECFGLTFRGINTDNIYKANEFVHLVTANAEYIVKANDGYPRLKAIINDNCTTLDGQIPFLIAKLKNNKRCSIEKISGSDFIYDYAKFANLNNKKILLIGGSAESNAIAVNNLNNQFNVDVAGISPEFEDYPFSNSFNQTILDSIVKFKPNAIFVGFGAIKQDYWIDDHRDYLISHNIDIAVGCGGSIDFVAGKQQRAPKFIQSIGFEGVYRFLKEPKLFRFKRLVLSFKIFRYI